MVAENTDGVLDAGNYNRLKQQCVQKESTLKRLKGCTDCSLCTDQQPDDFESTFVEPTLSSFSNVKKFGSGNALTCTSTDVTVGQWFEIRLWMVDCSKIDYHMIVNFYSTSGTRSDFRRYTFSHPSYDSRCSSTNNSLKLYVRMMQTSHMH